MLSNSIIANRQEHFCKEIANSVSAKTFTMDNDKELIEALIAYTGKSASELALAAKLTPSTLTRPLNHPVKHHLSQTTLKKLKEANPDFPHWFGEVVLESAKSQQDHLAIDLLPSFVGMGGGGVEGGDWGSILIPRRMVEDELHAKPKDLLMIEVRGESMEPDFKHGDQILIDRRDINPVQPGIFALWDGEAYVLKLVERIPRQRGRYRIFSANDRFSEYDVEEGEITIMGRPVWFGRRL